MRSNKCIISLATKNSRYVDGLARLSNSLRDNADGIDFLGFIHEASVNAPLHIDHPYAFKVYAIQKAIEAGYTSILWLDCSVYAVAPVQPIFDLIESNGYWFEGAGCWLGEWCNDRTLAYYNIDRNAAMSIPMIQSGFMGFDLTTEIASTLLSRFIAGYDTGLFKGEWNNTGIDSKDDRVLGHRHDQSVLSCILAYDYKFSHLPEYVQYAGIYYKVLNDKIILKCQGL